MQFIVDGRTSEVKYPILAEAETPFAIIKSQAETSQKIGVTTYTANNSQYTTRKIFEKEGIPPLPLSFPYLSVSTLNSSPLSTLSSKKVN